MENQPELEPVETPDEPAAEPQQSLRETLIKARDEAVERETVKVESAKPKTGSRQTAGKLSLPNKTENQGSHTATAENATAIAVQAKAPAAWKPEMRGDFEKLPPSVQKYITEREEEVHRGFTKLDEERNLGKSVKDVIQPYMPIINAEGGTPLTAIKTLLNTAYILRTAPPTQKVQLFKELAQQYGVNLQSVVQPAQQVHPVVQSLQDRIAQLEGTLNQQATREQQAQYELQQREQGTVNSLISEFSSNPANVHFEAVRPVMAALLESGVAKDLQDAYDRAIYASPEIRQQILEADRLENEQRRKTEAQTKTNAARRAGASVNGAPGVTVPNNGSPNRTLREEILANLRAATSG